MSYLSIFNNLLDCMGIVDFAGRVGSVESHFGSPPGIEWEGVSVTDVPVKSIELVVRHGVNRFLDHLGRHVVVTRV
jgi:hypothetical protein